MPHRTRIADRQPVRYRRKITGGAIPLVPSNLVLRSRTNYVPEATYITKGGRIVPAGTYMRGGGLGRMSNSTLKTQLGSAMSRGYY